MPVNEDNFRGSCTYLSLTRYASNPRLIEEHQLGNVESEEYISFLYKLADRFDEGIRLEDVRQAQWLHENDPRKRKGSAVSQCG